MKKIVVLGAAGLVGQNLMPLLRDDFDIVAVDKNSSNLRALKELNPRVTAIDEDLTKLGSWVEAVASADVVVSLNAQISGLTIDPFERNNVFATNLVLDAIKEKNPNVRLIHVSSSVVNSHANDFYSTTKRSQEELVVNSGIESLILRPTLMFGPLDRKHLGWLSRFMSKVPIFPIPGSGKFQRQPLYVKDFCRVIASAITAKQPMLGTFDISGRQIIDYIDLIKLLKKASGASSRIIRVPFSVFDVGLKFVALFIKNPPFTSQQLHALVIPEIFPIWDWPGHFKVKETLLSTAFLETYGENEFSGIRLEF